MEHAQPSPIMSLLNLTLTIPPTLLRATANLFANLHHFLVHSFSARGISFPAEWCNDLSMDCPIAFTEEKLNVESLSNLWNFPLFVPIRFLSNQN